MKPSVSLIPDRPRVVIELRRSMTDARKRRIHTRVGGKCWMCGKSVPVKGPTVRYDHKLPLELGGSDDDANLFPLHTDPCDKLKTAADQSKIAQARRRAGETCAGPTSRPIPTRVNAWPPKGSVKFRSRPANDNPTGRPA